MDNMRHEVATAPRPASGFLFCAGEFLPAPEYVVPLSLVKQSSILLPQSAEDAMRLLVDGMAREFVVPSLQSPSREEYFGFLRGRWHRIRECFSAMRAVFSFATSDEPAPEVTLRTVRADLVEAAKKVIGRSGAEEAAFAASTFQSATAVASRFTKLQNPSDAERDSSLATIFDHGAHCFAFGCISVVLAPDLSDASSPAILGAMEILRDGALSAYAAAREGFDLRRTPDDDNPADFVDFDDEDFGLAEATWTSSVAYW